MTTPATPAAPAATPATPAAPATPPPADSLLTVPATTPATPPATPPTEAAAPPATPPATPPPAAPEWFLADGVKGTGAKPDWFKEKYKTVEEQAKAYVAAEKRLGAFTGAPEGEYAVTIPEQYKGVVDVDTTNPVFAELGKFARESNMSQQGYDGIIGLLAKYEASVYSPPPTAEEAKTKIGANADTRLQSIGQYAGANFDEGTQKALKALFKPDNPYIAETVTAVEALIAKSRQPSMPKPGDGGDVPPVSELAAIEALHAAPDPKNPGKRLYQTDQAHREMVEERRRKYFAAQK
jgi:hypothetical protein